MMDNGQMARWVVQTEHISRMESQKRDERFWRDIRPDDPATQDTRSAGSRSAQPTGVLSFIKQRLASFSARLGTKQQPIVVK